MTFSFDPVLLTAFALALVRAVAWLFVAPPFNTRMVPTMVKAGVAATLALAAAPHVKDPQLALDTGAFLGALLTQVIVGISFGMLTMLLVNALQSAGSLIDLFAGFHLSVVLDPFTESTTAIFGRFYELVAFTLLFTTNAYLFLVNGFFRSFEVIPARGIQASDISDVLTKNMGQFFIAALEVAGPVLACLFLTEVTIGLLARAAPALNVFALAFPLRVVVALVVVALAVPLLGPAVGNLVHNAMTPFGVG